MTDERLYTFTPEENAQYDLQTELPAYRLRESRDTLDGYSCHSQPHVLEVMDEADRLFAALEPWLAEEADMPPMPLARRQVLLAAKLHDIGMCGTPEMRAVLAAADEAHQLAEAGLMGPVREKIRRLTELTARAGMRTPSANMLMAGWNDAYTASGRSRLMDTLARMHDEVKDGIRRVHARTGGRYVLRHRERFEKDYGPEPDWTEIGLLVALHAGGSQQRVDQPEADNATGQYIRELLTGYAPEELERCMQPDALRRLYRKAAIVRLADTRRSGHRMQMLDRSKVVVEKAPDGTLRLYSEKQGVRQPMIYHMSAEILLAEVCVEFGGLRLERDADGWLLSHDLLLKHSDVEQVRRLFAASRLETYCDELLTGLLSPASGMRHRLCIVLEGLDQAEAEAYAAGLKLPAGIWVEASGKPKPAQG